MRVIINPFTEMVPNVKAPEEEEEGTQSAETLGGWCAETESGHLA